jgi:hypothetical protein
MTNLIRYDFLIQRAAPLPATSIAAIPSATRRPTEHAYAAAAFLSAEVISRWGRGLTGMIVILLTAIHAVAAGGSFPAVSMAIDVLLVAGGIPALGMSDNAVRSQAAELIGELIESVKIYPGERPEAKVSANITDLIGFAANENCYGWTVRKDCSIMVVAGVDLTFAALALASPIIS